MLKKVLVIATVTMLKLAIKNIRLARAGGARKSSANFGPKTTFKRGK